MFEAPAVTHNNSHVAIDSVKTGRNNAWEKALREIYANDVVHLMDASMRHKTSLEIFFSLNFDVNEED